MQDTGPAKLQQSFVLLLFLRSPPALCCRVAALPVEASSQQHHAWARSHLVPWVLLVGFHLCTRACAGVAAMQGPHGAAWDPA